MRSSGRWLGRVRDECKNVPPVRPARLTIASVSSWMFSLLSAFFSRTKSTSWFQLFPSRSTNADFCVVEAETIASGSDKPAVPNPDSRL